MSYTITEKQPGATLPGLCSVGDGPVAHSEGVIRNPSLPGDHYDNNQLCLWRLSVPPGYSILLEFDRFQVEEDSYCQYDRLTVLVGTHMPVAVFCGHLLPGSVFLQNSQNATLLFSSDINTGGSGFVVRHRAVKGHPRPGCGTVILVREQGELLSPNYPQSYSDACLLRWVVYAPQGHVVKLDFTDFDLEESESCAYDSLTVLGDVEGAEEIAVLCGATIPPPVLSHHSVMVLRFTSDSSIAHRGFRASLTFIKITDLHDRRGAADEGWTGIFPASHRRSASSDPAKQQSSRRGLRYHGVVGGSEEAGPVRTSDDEDHSGESSGTDPAG
ncbi:ovochymase-2-like [Cololabis saira]|uniref:ovochymase-2-like n=1 Tax=Cololabis saira TaxID=129043 RepID=UPI002AD4B68E|nr:ovochymase-2-like [Cololabis saira]